jgi:hypothetical protein
MAVSLGCALNKYLANTGESIGYAGASLKNHDITSNLTQTESKLVALIGRKLSLKQLICFYSYKLYTD